MYRSGLMGIICTTGDCAAGRQSITEMDDAYKAADPSIQSQFQISHDALLKSFSDNYSWYSEWIPFNPACCGIVDLGAQADTLSAQIAKASNQQSPGGGPSTSTGWDLSAIFGSFSLGAVAAVGVGLYLLMKFGSAKSA
jgi:hypothetical protein